MNFLHEWSHIIKGVMKWEVLYDLLYTKVYSSFNFAIEVSIFWLTVKIRLM